MSEREPVWCIKESRGPWHATAAGYRGAESQSLFFALCQRHVYREHQQQHRQPDCERCLAILKRRMMRKAEEEQNKKQGVLFKDK